MPSVTPIDEYLEVCSRGGFLAYVVESPCSNDREACGCNVVKRGIHVSIGKHMDPVGVCAVEQVRATILFSSRDMCRNQVHLAHLPFR